MAEKMYYTNKFNLALGNIKRPRILSPSAADASSVHASTIVIDGGGTLSPVGRLASMAVEDAPAEAAGKRLLFRRSFGA